jgi:uncharacterized membrane protein YdbT with pleckstrin-like domain
MEETIKKAKLSVVALVFKLFIDLFACCILIGLVWFPRDLINYFTTKLEITNRRIKGKVGLIKTNELDSPLNKINSVQVKQGLCGKIFNYGTIMITTASSMFEFDYVTNPNEFKTILNNQIEAYEENKMDMQAQKIAKAMNK